MWGVDRLAGSQILHACGRSVVLQMDAPEPLGQETVIQTVPALLIDRTVQVGVRAGTSTDLIDLASLGAFAYQHQTAHLQVRRWPDELATDTEVWFGPALLYALAQFDIFALHASAFRMGSGSDAPTIACVAASGTGKSTVAAAAERRRWQRVADDVLPTTFDAQLQPVLMPHFPQLKLSATQQYPVHEPCQLPWSGLVRMERGASTALRTMSAREAAQLVLTHTLASRLFTPQRLAAHLRWVGQIETAVADGRLRAFHLSIAHTPLAPQTAAGQALDTLESRWTRP